MALNRYEVIGNVGKDPEIINTQGGNKIAKFSVGTNEYAGQKDGKASYDTEWHDVKVFGSSAEYVEKHLKKGDQVFVSGRKKTEKYEKDGNTKYFTYLQVGKLGKVERINKREGNGNGNGASNGAAEQAPAEESIPF